MKATRYFPMISSPRNVLGLRDELDRMIAPFLQATPFEGTEAFLPAVDIEENSEEFVVRADVPGVTHKDLKVSLMGDTLTIRGERLTPSNGATHRHRSERVHGSFERSFQLTTPVRGDQIQATFRDGVLEVRIPKADEARRREIDIQVS